MSAFKAMYKVLRFDGRYLYDLDINGRDIDGDKLMDDEELARCRQQLNPFSGPIELDSNCNVDLV